MRLAIMFLAADSIFGRALSSIDETFATDPDDEAIDPNDPPTDPDPTGEVESDLRTAEGAKCNKPELLSPTGLTLVIHVSKDDKNGPRAVAHLKSLRRFLRARDVFVIERGSPWVNELRAAFRCNRFHYIAYPDEMAGALDTGPGIDGIAVDWEGGQVEGHSQAWSIDQLASHRQKIRATGKSAGFVPYWSSRFNEATVARGSKMDYVLPQIQNACNANPDSFASRARGMLVDFHNQKVPLRSVGFEISLNSYDFADNHVGAERAADCTRKAYGKGARAIYLYGNGPDLFDSYLHKLAKLGLRRAS